MQWLILPVLGFIVFLVLVSYGCMAVYKESEHIKNNCAPTDLYVTGYNGHTYQVRDCANAN